MSYDLLLADGAFLLAEAAGEMADTALEEAIGKQPRRYRARLKHGLKHENPNSLDRKHIALARQYSKQAQHVSGSIQRAHIKGSKSRQSLDHNKAAEQHFKAAKIAKRAHNHFTKVRKPHLARAMNHLMGHHIKAYKLHSNRVHLPDMMYAGKQPFRGVLPVRGRKR